MFHVAHKVSVSCEIEILKFNLKENAINFQTRLNAEFHVKLT